MRNPFGGIKSVLTSAKIERYWLFLLAMALFRFADGLYRGTQDNYLAFLGFDEAGRGVVEFFRELPGLLLFLLLALFYRLAERKIIRIALGASAAGMLGLLLVGPNAIPAVACLVLWSTGEHLLMPVRRSYAIHAAEPGKEGMSLGVLLGVENVGLVLGLLGVMLVFWMPAVRADRDAGGRLGYAAVFVAALAIVGIAVIVAFGLRKSPGKMERKRLYFRRKFGKYYGLECFYGARKQVFLTFGPYLLILHYGARTEYIATLLLVCSVINIAFTPLIGKIIDRLGYRAVMIGDTILLFFVCLAYGFAHRLFSPEVAFAVVSVNFVLDLMISNASMASSVYVGRISRDKEEMAATLSTGISINHLISVAIAMAGGFIWRSLGVEILFVVAAAMALGNTLFAVTVPRVENPAKLQ